MIADLSYKDAYGYYGLRAEPSFDELYKTFKKKPTVIPVPKDRYYKYYALGPYRALILDAQKRYNDFEIARLNYQNSGAHAPEAAAAYTFPSEAQTGFQEQANHSDAADAYEIALDAANQDFRRRQQQTEAFRRQQLSTIGPNMVHPVIMANSDDLQEAGVPHAMPSPMPPRQQARYATPYQQYSAAGVPQGPQFRSFEELNLGQDSFMSSPSTTTTVSPSTPFGLPPSYEQLRRAAQQ